MIQKMRAYIPRCSMLIKMIIVVLILTCFQERGVGFTGLLDVRTAAQNQAGWRRVGVQEDNFSVLLPGTPEITSRGTFMLGLNGEQVNEERVASVYHNGVVYIVRMYKAPDIKKLFSKFPEIFHLSDANQSVLVVGGIEGMQFMKKEEGYARLIRVFLTAHNLYVLEAAARSIDNSIVRYFFLSLTLGEDKLGKAGPQPPTETPMPVALSDSKPLTEKEVTRPAVLIYNPQPPYTERAKRGRIRGTVTLRVVLSPTGEVTEVKLIKGLGGGLTESAAQQVKSIKFLPAEKDGQLVPQYSEISYNYEIFS